MPRIDIKPLSINAAFQGRRFKTPAYKKYEKDMLLLLPKIKLPEPPYKVYYEFGLSNKANDWDNSIKMLQDLLQEKYKFNDKDIYEGFVRKVIVKKGCEYIYFEIKNLQD